MVKRGARRSYHLTGRYEYRFPINVWIYLNSEECQEMLERHNFASSAVNVVLVEYLALLDCIRPVVDWYGILLLARCGNTLLFVPFLALLMPPSTQFPAWVIFLHGLL